MHVVSSRWLPLAPLALLAAASTGACFGSSTKASSSDAGTTLDVGTGGDDGGGTVPAAGGTGAFGIVTVNGKQKMYLPAGYDSSSGNGVIAVVDVGVAGNGASGAPALITTIDLGSTNVATATGGDSTMVIAASTDNPTVWFIDPATDTLKKSFALDGTYGQSGFSGGGGYVTGVAIDSAEPPRHPQRVERLRARRPRDAVDHQTVIQAPPAENFGFDSVHQRILAPFYDCAAAWRTGCRRPRATRPRRPATPARWPPA